MEVAQLIKESRPFIIIEYYEWLKINKTERFKCYEVIYHKENSEKFTSYFTTTFKDIQKFKDYLFLKQKCKDGKIWEFMEFRLYCKAKKLIWH